MQFLQGRACGRSGRADAVALHDAEEHVEVDRLGDRGHRTELPGPCLSVNRTRHDGNGHRTDHRIAELGATELTAAEARHVEVEQDEAGCVGAAVPHDSQLIPTVILGYEFKWTANTNLNIQAYVSNSVYSHQQTDLDELLGMKYEYSIGLRHRMENWLLSFGFTENVQNVNNTPDVGFQLGVAWIPRGGSR